MKGRTWETAAIPLTDLLHDAWRGWNGDVHGCHMGRKRRGGYFFVWFKGDHEPRHVHVFDHQNRLLGRVRLDTYDYLEGGRPPPAVIAIIVDFQHTGIL